MLSQITHVSYLNEQTKENMTILIQNTANAFQMFKYIENSTLLIIEKYSNRVNFFQSLLHQLTALLQYLMSFMTSYVLLNHDHCTCISYTYSDT